MTKKSTLTLARKPATATGTTADTASPLEGSKRAHTSGPRARAREEAKWRVRNDAGAKRDESNASAADAAATPSLPSPPRAPRKPREGASAGVSAGTSAREREPSARTSAPTSARTSARTSSSRQVTKPVPTSANTATVGRKTRARDADAPTSARDEKSPRRPRSTSTTPTARTAGTARTARATTATAEADSARPRTPRAPPVRINGDAEDGRIRLSKLMSERGLASRREADDWIAKGWIIVDGEVIREHGTRVLPTASIEVSKAAHEEQQTRVTILMNKPMGYVSGQAEDGHQPASVLFLAANRWDKDASSTRFHPMQAKGLAPAGRLDIDSVGLLVFTQDGRVAKQLIGEDSGIEKEYLVRVEGGLSADGMKKLHHGLSLDGEALRPAKVSWQNEHQLRFVLREGKKRQIRRMCELVGLKVVGLKRIRIGKITLGDLPPGKWRYLGPQESFA
jgi:23S rRNA pseudouridine2604 synthase